MVSPFRQPELSGKKGPHGAGNGRRERRERRPNRELPAHAPGARELAVIKISSDSGLMHEMMADDCRRRRRMILVRDLAMVASFITQPYSVTQQVIG